MAATLQPKKIEEQQSTPEPQTWTHSVLVPLAQNILGGLAVAGTLFLFTLATTQVANQEPSLNDVLFWSLIVGGLVTCGATVTRFFGDDVGIVRAAYKAGQKKMLAQVNTLQLQLETAHQVIRELTDKTGVLPNTKAEARLSEARKDAETLIRWHFEDIDITREQANKLNMGQQRWSRARAMLIGAGAHDGEEVTAYTAGEAIQLLDEHYQRLITTGDRSERYVAPV